VEAAGKDGDNRTTAPGKTKADAAESAQIRNVFFVRSGRGLAVIDPKTPKA
jgi:hypothetical protein